MDERNSQAFFPGGQTPTAELKSDLEKLLGKSSGDRAKIAETIDSLIAKYSEEHRFYHNLSHVRALLQNVEKFMGRLTDADSVRLAVWFHDAIYEPKSLNNETESAALAVAALTELEFPAEKIGKVESMILATQKHDAAGLDFDGRLFLDLDLGILGARAEIYKKYAQAIRAEYSFAPESLYREKRRLVMTSFLRREFIYYTDELRESHESAARFNIENEIKELS